MRIDGQGAKLVSWRESYRWEVLDAPGADKIWTLCNAAEQLISRILRQAQGITTLEPSAVTRFTIVEHESDQSNPDLQKLFDTEVHVLPRYCSHEAETVETFGATFHQQ